MTIEDACVLIMNYFFIILTNKAGKSCNLNVKIPEDI